MAKHPKLEGMRVLVVEDAFLIAEELCAMLSQWGCEVVGPTGKIDPALALVTSQLDGALLDVNLGDRQSFPIAKALGQKGVPFIFLSGYDMPSIFPPEFENVVRLAKPVDKVSLAHAMTSNFSCEPGRAR